MKIDDFGAISLSAGAHKSLDAGMCVMEMVSFLNGEKWSDSPECTCPVLAAFCRRVNDRFGQEQRDELQTLVPVLIDTRSPEHERARAEKLAWGAVRKFAPFWFRKAGLTEWAERMEVLVGTFAEARKAAADAADEIFPIVMEVLREAIAAGPHGEAWVIEFEGGQAIANSLDEIEMAGGDQCLTD